MLIEAMAAGLPVVQPRHAGFPELVGPAGGGILVEPGNISATARLLNMHRRTLQRILAKRAPH